MTITELVEKEYDPKLEQGSVVETPTKEERRGPTSDSFLLQVAEAAQSITPWGRRPVTRDKELRSFWHSESWLSSVVYLVSIRNASFAWEIIGSNPERPEPRNTIRTVTRILNQSNRGKGWKDFILRTCIDLYTQDNGSFWEIIRNGRGPNAPVVNLSHLDSARCRRTGDPKFPVIYYNRYGKEIFLPHWRVRTIEEFPSPVEDAYGLQYCAVSRSLMAAEVISSISTYKLEKVSGNFTRAVNFISGPTQNNINDALAMAEEQNLNKGVYRFSLPVIVPGIDPTTSLSHVQIDLASLPDNFDEDTSFKWYVAQLAAAFGVDYQEIAPLMTGNLGSSQQSEIMHLKTRGKGPALIMGMFEDIINQLIPSNVEFKFLEQDIRSEREKADAKFTRVKARSMQIESGELTPEAAREMAVVAGDMPRWLKNQVDEAAPQPIENPRFGPDQLAAGVATEIDPRNKGLTKGRIKEIQKFVSENPIDMVERWVDRNKASVGHPAGTVIVPVMAPLPTTLNEVLADLSTAWRGSRARILPSSSHHITMVYSPLIDDIEFRSIAQRTENMFGEFPFKVEADKLETFDTPNGKAVVLAVKDNPTLNSIQTRLHNAFSAMGVTTSEFSVPSDWKPHITLAYIDESLTVPDVSFNELWFTAEFPRFTRSEYRQDFVAGME